MGVGVTTRNRPWAGLQGGGQCLTGSKGVNCVHPRAGQGRAAQAGAWGADNCSAPPSHALPLSPAPHLPCWVPPRYAAVQNSDDQESVAPSQAQTVVSRGPVLSASVLRAPKATEEHYYLESDTGLGDNPIYANTPSPYDRGHPESCTDEDVYIVPDK